MENESSKIIVGKGIIADIIRGEEVPLIFLRNQADESEIAIPHSCILEGLELAEEPTCQGLHWLAELISMAELVSLSNSDQERTGNPTIMLTTDVLLSCLIGIIESETIASCAQMGKPVIYDAFLVAALLCVAEEDQLDTRNLAGALREITLKQVDVPPSDRRQWPQQLSQGAKLELRAKALQGRDRRAFGVTAARAECRN